MNEEKFELSDIAVCQGKGGGEGTHIVHRHRIIKRSRGTFEEIERGNKVVCAWHTVGFH